MRKTGVISLIVGVALTVVGAAVIFFVNLSVDFDYSKLNFDILSMSSISYDTKNYDVTDDFSSIYIDESSADITLSLSTDGKSHVVSNDREDVSHTVEVVNNELRVIREDKSVSSFGIFFAEQDISLTLYLPENYYKSIKIDTASSDVFVSDEFEFDDLEILTSSGSVQLYPNVHNSLVVSASSGDVSVNNIGCKELTLDTSSGEVAVSDSSAENIHVSTTSGDVKLTDVDCSNIICESSSGEQLLTNLIATEKLNMDTSSGSIYLYDCDANELYFDTISGEVYGELLTQKIFVTDTSSGDIDISSNAYGNNGKCEANTTSGDITFKLSE